MTSVTFKNQKYKLLDQAYVYSDSSYTDGTIWASKALRLSDNKKVELFWHSTNLRDEQESRFLELNKKCDYCSGNLQELEQDEYLSLEGALSDDSDACDWENPYQVKEIG